MFLLLLFAPFDNSLMGGIKSVLQVGLDELIENAFGF